MRKFEKFELTPEQLVEFKKDLRSDMTLSDLAKKHKVTARTISRFVNRTTTTKENLHEDEISAIKELLTEGKTDWKIITRRFNIMWATLYDLYIEFFPEQKKQCMQILHNELKKITGNVLKIDTNFINIKSD